jgi:GAF domain-containing protein
MAEPILDPDLTASKADRYAQAAEQIAAVAADEPDLIARMSTAASMLAAAFPNFLWTGFYRVDPADARQLVVGPYQGTLGCLRIAVGRGVCGTAAQRRETIVVPDVEAFEGHIACDSRSRSEIVVPVIDGDGDLLAVLDVDSARAGDFDAVDATGLERIVARLFGGSAA